MTKTCACGCGKEIAEGKTWYHGHHLKKHTRPGNGTKEELERLRKENAELRLQLNKTNSKNGNPYCSCCGRHNTIKFALCVHCFSKKNQVDTARDKWFGSPKLQDAFPDLEPEGPDFPEEPEEPELLA